MEPTELCSRIENAENIVDLAAALLLFCRRHQTEYRLAENWESIRSAEKESIQAAQSWFAERSEELDEDNRARALAALRSNSDIPLVVRARALAVGLDQALGHRFYGVFRSSRVRRLQPDDPVPVTRPPLREILGALNAPPERLDPRVDRLPNLRLAPADLQSFEVDLDFTKQDLLGPLLDPENQIFATCHPNRSLSEFEPLNDNTPKDSFFWFQPKDGTRQGKIVRALFERAVQAGATVVLFPELCLDAGSAAAWVKEVVSPQGSVRLLVTGSHHVEVAGRRRTRH